MLEDWISAVIVPMYKGKGERTECSNYGGISLLSVVEEIYAGILVDRVCKARGVQIREVMCTSDLHPNAGK